MEIEIRPLAEIRPYPNNARKVTKKAVDKVAASLRIVVGHVRHFAAQKLGWDEAPVHVAENLTAEQIYMRTKNAPWFGRPGENSIVWDSPSPKFIMGGSAEQKYDYPTQKPIELMRKPILNHLRPGELVYDPFPGCGTTLAAAELSERVCCGIEIDPGYVDVAVLRWQSLNGNQATLEGDGRSFAQVKAERMALKADAVHIP